MRTPLQEFLIERKMKLLELEKRATGAAKGAMLAQIQMADAICIFLASQQTEENMAKLRLTLDKQATPVDDIKPRQDTQELATALIELASDLKTELEAKHKKDPSITALKYPLNNIPSNVKPKSVSSKIYNLKKAGKLPENIWPATRTIKEKVKDKDGKEVVKLQEVLYMRCDLNGKGE